METLDYVLLFVAVAVVWKLVHWIRWIFSKKYRQKMREKKATRQRRKARRSGKPASGGDGRETADLVRDMHMAEIRKDEGIG